MWDPRCCYMMREVSIQKKVEFPEDPYERGSKETQVAQMPSLPKSFHLLTLARSFLKAMPWMTMPFCEVVLSDLVAGLEAVWGRGRVRVRGGRIVRCWRRTSWVVSPGVGVGSVACLMSIMGLNPSGGGGGGAGDAGLVSMCVMPLAAWAGGWVGWGRPDLYRIPPDVRL
ncbi:hypothetical protein BDZ91DRAFT_838580 [Kalaharituber pfeilii]|nr:hypothetical protein BDZ91DRAFT_838580 [Kalaharituber pfeilii]